MKTTILRDTGYSFVKTLTKENGKSFARKLEKGTPEYTNACFEFHSNGVALEIGNKIEK